ncbi:MAG: 2,3-bisphosphoglycerate-independent phosphoglycerate mutase, partial [Clostridia bacterium]|nr:2,3-bisphosphoglycerate-independent phosphoglycerate mutase [Clostridia bacterium]
MELKEMQKKIDVKGPVVVLVLDGVGINPKTVGNAVKAASTPTLDRLMSEYPTLSLKAHGTAVGLPSDDDMGNSEVGHNALGSGQIFAQGAKLVSNSIESGKIYEGEGWKKVSGTVKENNSTLHFMGLFSDGNVHSHIDHLKALIEKAKEEGIKKVRCHILLDGRDVAETSALEYVEPFEAFLVSLNDASFDAKIASGGGRMSITMDRYEANWQMVKAGWDIHVLGEGRKFASAKEAIETYREELKVIDQDLPGFVIAEDGKAVGTIEDGDGVIFFNFRGDRSIEISKAFCDEEFPYFDRVRFPKTAYAGMLEYDGDLHIPPVYLVAPPEITNTMGEYLAK